jgi:hypothetical protein
VIEADAHPLGDVVGCLAVVRADVDDARAELAVGSPLHPLVDLRHLPRAVLQHELVGSRLEKIGEVAGVRLLRVRQLAERSEADVQTEMHAADAVDARVEQPGDVGRRVRIVRRIAGGGRFVELDPLATGAASRRISSFNAGTNASANAVRSA